MAVFQWDPVNFSNGPVTGYRLYIGDSDGISVQGASNTTLEVSVRRNVEIRVRVVAINSAGEGTPAVRDFSLNGKVNNYIRVVICKNLMLMLIISAAPGILHTFLLNMSSVRLFWDPPALFIVDFMHYLLKCVKLLISVMVISNSQFIYIVSLLMA